MTSETAHGHCAFCGQPSAVRVKESVDEYPQYRCLNTCCGVRWTKGLIGEPWDILQRALWEKDQDTLEALAACECCCDEHFSDRCPARAWCGCRGQASFTHADYVAWQGHYRKLRGLSPEAFSGACYE